MKPTPELIKLVDQCLARKISRVEMARLEQLLENDDNLQYYLEIAGIEGDLPAALSAGVIMEPKVIRASLIQRLIMPLSLATAAAVIFFAGFYVGKPPAASDPAVAADTQPGPRLSGNGAAITSLIGVTWQGKAPDTIKLSAESSPLAIKSGLVELTFDSGVRSIIEGPATFKVTGGNSAEFGRGRLVADVPKGAEGFTVVYPDGKVIDLGTEFAINVPQNQKGAEVGVFRGEVEVYDHQQNKALKILENHAVVQISGSTNPFASIPFHREDYIRELPSREFPWTLPTEPSPTPSILEFDVSHLVWKSGTYRAVIKYMKGQDALSISKVELLLDQEVVATDEHFGRTGLFKRTADNIYTLRLTPEQHRKGKWTLRIIAAPDTTDSPELGTFSPDSSGILLFEDSRTSPDSFVGTWEYRHDGDIHRRVFTADHRAEYYLNGKKLHLFDSATWKIEDDTLVLTIPPHDQGDPATHRELHLLRNSGELIFVNRPYRNALKVN